MSVQKYSVLVAAVSLTFTTTFAAQKTLSPEQLQREMQRLMQHTAALEHEVQDLRSEVKQLKSKRVSRRIIVRKDRRLQSQPTHKHATLKANTRPDRSADLAPIKQSATPELDRYSKAYQIREISHLWGTPVVTSPYVGVRSRFDGSDLIVNLPSMNEDLRLIQQRQRFENELIRRGLPLPEHPLLELSGKLETQAIWRNPAVGKQTGDVDLDTVEIDAVSYVDPWVTGYISIDYDNFANATGVYRVANSRLKVNRAFITVGQLRKFPVYFTAGQMFIPFGKYSGYMVTMPLTEELMRIRARAVLLGYKQPGEDGFILSGFGFRGDAKHSRSGAFGANASYHFTHGPLKGRIGASYITNIANAIGQQQTGGVIFNGFAFSPATELLNRNVPGLDVRGALQYGPFSILGEYVTGLREFSPLDLTFNKHGAKIAAADIEGAYHFRLCRKPSAFAIGYGRTYEALAFDFPKSRYSATFSINIWRDTIESIEYRHEENYPLYSTSMGRSGFTGALMPYNPLGSLGRSDDKVTAQIALFY